MTRLGLATIYAAVITFVWWALLLFADWTPDLFSVFIVVFGGYWSGWGDGRQRS